MFKNVLIPISSEFYQRNLFKTALMLHKKIQPQFKLLYIIEQKTLHQTDKISTSYRTAHDQRQTQKEIISQYVHSADSIVFDDAKRYFTKHEIPFEEQISQGEFSTVIHQEVRNNGYDLILMGFDKKCTLQYRLFRDAPIPIWVDVGHPVKKALAVCSNLAPNLKVPEISLQLARLFKWQLQMLYVVDTQDRVEVDVAGRRSSPRSEEDLRIRGKQFVTSMQKQNVPVELVKGSLEKQTVKAAKKMQAQLVIIGREQKKKTLLSLPARDVKKKIAESCPYSILFLH